MVNFRIFFGLVPATEDYEAKQSLLRKEYEDLQAFLQSDELIAYKKLDETVHSADFARRKKEIMAKKYPGSPEYRKEKEFNRLKKKKDIVNYYQIRDSVELKDFLDFDRSQDVKHYHTLEKHIHSAEFLNQKKRLGRKFKDTEDFEKLQEFKALKKSERFKDYFKYKTSKSYVNFNLLIGSEKIAAFEQLQQYIQSEDFKKAKEFLLLPGRKKYELSEEYKLEQQYHTLYHSEKVQLYLKNKDKAKYKEVRRWELTFEEDFNTELDKKKWLTRYFWGELLLGDSYSLDQEKQFMNDDKNLAVADSKLIISTREEKVTGKAWNPAIGFFPRDFNYTSGMINTGCSFRQQYGLFEAKVRFNRNYPVNHAIWLVSDTFLPHIDLAKSTKKIFLGNFWNDAAEKGRINKNESNVSLSRYGSGFYIFSLEWKERSLTWKINGVPVRTCTEGIPKIPMYINISSSMYADSHDSILPARLEVDWIRCYREVQ